MYCKLSAQSHSGLRGPAEFCYAFNWGILLRCNGCDGCIDSNFTILHISRCFSHTSHKQVLLTYPKRAGALNKPHTSIKFLLRHSVISIHNLSRPPGWLQHHQKLSRLLLLSCSLALYSLAIGKRFLIANGQKYEDGRRCSPIDCPILSFSCISVHAMVASSPVSKYCEGSRRRTDFLVCEPPSTYT